MEKISYNEFRFLRFFSFKFLFDLIRTSYCKTVEFKKRIQYDAWVIIETNHKNDFFRVLYIGKSELDRRYIRDLLFDSKSDEFYLGKIGILRVLFHLCGFKKCYDLIVFNSRTKICKQFKTKNSLVIPVWIKCEIDLNNDVKTSCISKSTLKTNLKIIKRGNFDWFISNDPVDFDYFYYKLFLPYIENRHGQFAFKQSFEEMEKDFNNGELILIKEENTIVSGGLIVYKKSNGLPLLSKIGVLEGDFNYVKRGALVAIYYFTIQYLNGKKHNQLCLGFARPFLHDGILRHKLNWGAKIVCDSSNAFLFLQLSKKDFYKRLLSDKPFVVRNKNKLCLSVFSDQCSIGNIYSSKEKKQIGLWGLDGIKTFSGSPD